MSNEENTEQQNVEQAAVDAIEPEVTVTESVAEQTVVDSVDEKTSAVAQFLQLKDKNPKVFFGAIGGVVLLLILALSGGEDKKAILGPVIKNLAVGEKYVLKSANSYDPSATVRLVAVPGAIAAYDDTEEVDRNTPCQHIPQGTAVSILELQDAYGTKNAFVKVQIEAGDCKGKDGWALAIDVQ